MIELWKPVVGYEGYYEVSSLGNVKAIYATNNQYKPGRILKKNVIKGYSHVQLHRAGVKCKRIHRLVAEAFIPNPHNKATVNHINGLKSDNRVENLEWNTLSENEQHSYDILNKTPWNKGITGYKVKRKNGKSTNLLPEISDLPPQKG
jgi:hypothetical protein